MNFQRYILLVVLSMLLFSCAKDDEEPTVLDPDYSTLLKYLDVPQQAFPYDEYDIPQGLKDNFLEAQDNMPANNLTTAWGATLGRVLFYDSLLSRNSTIACASCHQQKQGFSDSEILSEGYLGGLTGRHSMGLSNARYYANGHFFWDERAATLEDQVLMPIQDSVEMGMTLNEVVDRLNQTEYYPILFRKAFGSEEIDSDKMSKAMAQFVRSIVSYNSRFDNGLIASNYDPVPPFSDFSPAENRGKQIFFTNRDVPCAGCHLTSAMVGDNPRNNGVFDGDQGVYAHNPKFYLLNTFKSPSLRNVAIRAPYMHNGQFPNLEAVIEHYNSGLTNPDGSLDPHLLKPGNIPAKMNLSQEDKDALKAFLLTLTDEVMLNEEAYSNPFK